MADCPLTLTPSEVAVRFGDQVSINCSTSATDALGMGWEAAVGGKGFKNVTAVTWTVERIEEWTIKPDCYITLNNWQCTVTPNITLYSEYKSTNATIVCLHLKGIIPQNVCLTDVK